MVWDNPALFADGGDALEGSFFSVLFSSETSDSAAVRFVEAYRVAFGISPDGAAAMGYDAMRLLGQAIRRADTLEGAAIRDQIAATQDYRGATKILRFDENRHPIKSGAILTIQNGEVRFHQQVEP